MKHIHFDIESDGFYGAYWACKDGSDCAVLAMIGDDPEDYMARSAVKWLLRLGPQKQDGNTYNVSVTASGRKLLNIILEEGELQRSRNGGKNPFKLGEEW